MQFGSRSNEKLNTAHVDLQKIMRLAIARTKVDFGISEGHRSIERQYELYKMGRSKIDGKEKKGKHNYSPSLAVDIYAYHRDSKVRKQIAYDKVTLSYIAGVIDSCSIELYYMGEIEHIARWGANWDSDGVIALDQSFDDYPHFELIKPSKSSL